MSPSHTIDLKEIHIHYRENDIDTPIEVTVRINGMLVTYEFHMPHTSVVRLLSDFNKSLVDYILKHHGQDGDTINVG